MQIKSHYREARKKGRKGHEEKLTPHPAPPTIVHGQIIDRMFCFMP